MNVAKNISKGAKGLHVRRIQYFLAGGGYYQMRVDNSFGPGMKKAVAAFQAKHELEADGIVGNETLAKMMAGDMKFIGPVVNVPQAPAPKAAKGSASGSAFPPRPPFSPLTSNKARAATFGSFSFRHSPVKGNRERVKVTDGWAGANLVTVNVPQLDRATNGKFKRMTLHKKVVHQTLAFWSEIEAKGLLHLVKTYEGSYNPRFIRGSRRTLSNHAWATAFDINYWWNRLGRTPARRGAEGSVVELVEIAHKHGFYWGGHFSRGDGMHFEVAVPLPKGKVLDIDYSQKSYKVIAA